MDGKVPAGAFIVPNMLPFNEIVFNEFTELFEYVIPDPVKVMFLELPDLSIHVVNDAPFEPGAPVAKGSLPSNHTWSPDTLVGLVTVVNVTGVEPAGFTAFKIEMYDVPPLRPVNVAELLVELDGIADIPFKVYV